MPAEHRSLLQTGPRHLLRRPISFYAQDAVVDMSGLCSSESEGDVLTLRHGASLSVH
jgi:hypothetical protein